VRVPLFATSLERYHDRLGQRIAGVVRSGRYILGPEVEAFERDFAAYLGVRHVVGVGNGTDALTIALRASGVGEGDEVICPSLTFYATAEAIVNAGATPVFCDVDLATLCITPETVRPHLGRASKAIVPVHVFGNIAPVRELRELGLPVIEDAAQAAGGSLHGVRAGALGDAATFSFFPSKNLPCLGDGGAIATDSGEIAEWARLLRFHGSRDKHTYSEVGYNSRLDAIQAAVLGVLLPELDGWNAARRNVASQYERAGLGEFVRLPVPTPGAEHAYHLYVVRTAESDALASALADVGIAARRYYATPVHRQVPMLRFADRDLPATDEIARSNLALPMGTDLGEQEILGVVEACATAVSLASP